MPAGCGDLQGTLDMLLALDLREIHGVIRRIEIEVLLGDLHRLGHEALLQQADTVVEVLGGVDLEIVHHGGFLAVVRRDDQGTQVPRPGAKRDRQCPRHTAQMPVQGQLTDQHYRVEVIYADLAGSNEDAQRNGQIKGGSFLANIGGRQVDSYPLYRELEAAIADGRLDALSALAHGSVGQAHSCEAAQAPRDVHLNLHRIGINTQHRSTVNASQHGKALSPILYHALP